MSRFAGCVSLAIAWGVGANWCLTPLNPHCLTASEVCEIYGGQVTCDGHIDFNRCGDLLGECYGSQEECSGNCSLCTASANVEMQQATPKDVYIEAGNIYEGGCGQWVVDATCTWVSGACTCEGGPVTNINCSQYTVDIYNTDCIPPG